MHRLPVTQLRIGVLLVLLTLSASVLAACGGGSDGSANAAAGTTAAAGGSGGSQTLSLVAYSTPREVYEELIPVFQGTPDGTGVEFEQSYASSGEQSRAVEAGLPADYVAFSLEPDVTRLVDAGLVAPDWQTTEQYDGMVSNSVVVFVVREGNPKGIDGWEDLVTGDVEVITPNPFTSGGAKWNLMAAYGAQLEEGKTEDEAVQYLADLLAATPVQDKSAREALQTFSAGKGDVMLAYENEAIFAIGEGQPFEYIVPDQTILIENPAAATVDSTPAAAAWLEFVQSPEAQQVFGEHGYRPVDPDVAAQFDFPEPTALFTIADLGGWSEVNETFFDRDNGIVAGIEQELGVPTDG
jgi:sulfate/thiosulfate transport system substrate-binding protein